jgi:outer membrane receptor protein involved in Fe transport
MLLLAVAVLLSPVKSTAQQSDDADQEYLQEIVVTGSRIPKNDFTSSSPLTTIDDFELRIAGITSVEEALDRLPQVIPGLNRTANTVGNRTATVNLRGLGDNRSLVLLNGRRMVPASSNGAVDLNNIPTALVERVEVITGGASAVYGSDALTGAVNFLLRNDYEGLEVSTQYDVTEKGDGEVLNVNIAGGLRFAEDRVSLTGYFNYMDRQSVLAGDRTFTREELFDDIFTGEIIPSGNEATPAGTILDPAIVGNIPAPNGVTFQRDGTPRPFERPDDLFNFAPFYYLQVPLERKSVALFFDVDMLADTSLYAEYMFNDISQASETAPSAFGLEAEMNIDNPLLTVETRQLLENFFDPDGDGIATFFFLKRLPEFGSRNQLRNTTYNRVVAGIKSDILTGWLVDVHAIYSESDAENWTSNHTSINRFAQSLLVDPVTMECFDTSGGCQPANIFGEGNMSIAALDFVRLAPFSDSEEVKQVIVNTSLVGTLVELPAGNVDVAVGVEFRKDDYAAARDDVIDQEVIVEFPIAPPLAGQTDLGEIFGEIVLPLASDKRFAQYLGLEAGYRYSDHSIAGEFDTWKLAAEWRPAEAFALRASVQNAIRVPSVDEYFRAESVSIGFVDTGGFDPCSASRQPQELGVAEVCIAQGIPASQIGIWEEAPPYQIFNIDGGNLELEIEQSDTLTAGIVIEPGAWPNFALAFDYYEIEIDNAVQVLNPFSTFQFCFDVNDPGDPLCQAVMRDPVTFNVASVRGGPRNVATLTSRGYDLQIVLDHDLPSWLALFEKTASLQWSFIGNHALEYGERLSQSADFRNCAGFIGWPCGAASFGTLPENKTNTRVTYDSGPLALSLQWIWIDGMRDAFFEYGLGLLGLTQDDVNLFFSEISSKSYLALSFEFSLHDNVEIFGGVNNLTGTEPPLLVGAQTQANTDPSVYDVFGRQYFLGFRARFFD